MNRLTKEPEKKIKKCPAARQCGGCRYQGVPYQKQLALKQEKLNRLLGEFGEVRPILGMEDPYYYRNKVHHSFTRDRSGNIIHGPYEQGSHWILDVKDCLIEDRKAQEIIETVAQLLKTFHLRPYDEDRHTGFLRRVLVRRGFSSGEIMVVLVTGMEKFPQEKAFLKALLEAHPDNGFRSQTYPLSYRHRDLFTDGKITASEQGKSLRTPSCKAV